MGHWRSIRGPAIAHALAALALWPVPLVGMLHAEGAAVTAFATFFIAGIAAIGAFARGEAPRAVVRRHVALLAIPWALLTLSILWRPNCGYALGLGLFALMVVPSALLAVALADALVTFRVARPRWTFVGLGVGLAVVPPLVVLTLCPQLFVYNPVFGGVLGPIYDVELAVRTGFLVHQGGVVIASAGFLALAQWRRQPGGRAGWVALACGAVIATQALVSTPLGVTQSEANLRRALGAEAASERVVLHFEPGSIPRARAERLLDEAEFRLWQIERELGIRPAELVHVYLYPDADTKAALIGSRETSVVPVWLSTPQVHLLDARADGDLGHELVHVAAREAGSAITGATWKVGLVEGLAVALEAPEGTPSPEQQVVAAQTLPRENGGLADPADEIVGAMDPLGFWTGRAGASYTTTGAFTRWLLDTYGAAPLLAVYGGESWRSAYGRDLRQLAEAWGEHLSVVEAGDEARAFATWRFGIPSLFEVRCPHHVPLWQRRLREGDEAWKEGRLWATASPYAHAARLAPDSLGRALAEARLALSWALQDRRPNTARSLAMRSLRADTASALLQSRLEVAHATALRGEESDELYRDVIEALPPYAREQRAVVEILSRLTEDELRDALLPAPDSVATAGFARRLAKGSAEAQFVAALRFADAGDPTRAWEAAREAVAVLPPDPTLTLAAARLAYRVGDLDAADDLAHEALDAYTSGGLRAPARLAADLRQRVGWKRATTP